MRQDGYGLRESRRMAVLSWPGLVYVRTGPPENTLPLKGLAANIHKCVCVCVSHARSLACRRLRPALRSPPAQRAPAPLWRNAQEGCAQADPASGMGACVPPRISQTHKDAQTPRKVVVRNQTAPPTDAIPSTAAGYPNTPKVREAAREEATVGYHTSKRKAAAQTYHVNDFKFAPTPSLARERCASANPTAFLPNTSPGACAPIDAANET